MDFVGLSEQLSALLSDEPARELPGARVDGAGYLRGAGYDAGHDAGYDNGESRAVGINDRKVDRVMGQEEISVQEFADRLAQLLTVLDKDKVAYIGRVREYLERCDGAQNLLDILPRLFVDRLLNDIDWPQASHRYLASLLDDAVAALKHGADLQQTKEHLDCYVQMMNGVFVQGIFESSAGQSRKLEVLFEAAIDLQLCVWQRDHANVPELSVLGAKPWEDSEVMSCLAQSHGYVFCSGQSVRKSSVGTEPSGGDESSSDDKSSGSDKPSDVPRDRVRVRPVRILDPLCAPWHRYFSSRQPAVRVEMPNHWRSSDTSPEVEKLANLKTGFYDLSFDNYLFVGDATSPTRFSVYRATGIQFGFQDPLCLYEYLDQNHYSYVKIEALEYCPRYFIHYIADTGVPDHVSEALATLGLDEGSLSSVNYKDFVRNFRKQALLLHPDKIGDIGHERFCRLSQARETVEQWLQGQWVDDNTQDEE